MVLQTILKPHIYVGYTLSRGPHENVVVGGLEHHVKVLRIIEYFTFYTVREQFFKFSS